MLSPNIPSEWNVSPSVYSGTHALIAAIALSLSACVWPQNNQNYSNNQHPYQSKEETEYDIDNPLFIALVSISAEVQASMECSENRSLQFVWETVSQRLQEMNIKENVSVSLCPPQKTERGFAYILVDVGNQQMQIFAKNQKSAQERTREVQESCITYISERVRILLGDAPATQEKLKIILQDEETVLAKHRMIAIIKQDNNDSWTISFEADV